MPDSSFGDAIKARRAKLSFGTNAKVLACENGPNPTLNQRKTIPVEGIDQKIANGLMLYRKALTVLNR